MGALVPSDFTLADLPLPAEPTVDGYWTRQMREWAEVMGPLAVLRLVDAVGGSDLYVPVEPEGTKLEGIVGADAARALSDFAGRTSLRVPVARAALNQAKRAGVLAAVRAGTMTATRAARHLGTSRQYVYELVNRTDEGEDVQPVRLGRRSDPRQRDLFATDAPPADSH